MLHAAKARLLACLFASRAFVAEIGIAEPVPFGVLDFGDGAVTVAMEKCPAENTARLPMDEIGEPARISAWLPQEQ
jgi:hypothetical protein